MAEIKQCDRCKKVVDTPNDIGVTLEILRFETARGYIRPTKTILKEIKRFGQEYLPITFKEHLFGTIELCSDCFHEFMTFHLTPKDTLR